jgi:cyclohexanecarboxylate-CoA ligase
VTDVHQPDDAATSDGRVVYWMELKVIGPDGAELPRGEQGRLVSRGPSQFLGYLKRQDLYDESLTADGFFDSGDLARMDETGAIRITGRTKDLIIRGGENVPAVEVEACLYRHPDINEVAVVGLPDDRLGERAAAAVVTNNRDLTLSDLRAFLDGEGMAKSFWPESLTVVDEMPRTPSGKIQKFALRDRLLADKMTKH